MQKTDPEFTDAAFSLHDFCALQHLMRLMQDLACSATSIAETPPMLQRSDSLDHSTALSLDNIRQSLIRQEDTIIFSLIERAQFAANEPVYQSGAIAVPGKRPHCCNACTLLPECSSVAFWCLYIQTSGYVKDPARRFTMYTIVP